MSASSFEALLELNETRTAAFLKHPFFSVLEEATLRNARKREVLLACVQRFSTNFQALLFIRQGLCADPKYQRVFLRHLTEELGHDELLKQRESPRAIADTLFEAILGWFNYQMVVLDNAERTALMHLVLETAGDHFHSLAAPRLRSHVQSPYFDTHAELDADHADLGTDLLRGHGASTYDRLCDVVNSGWDMMEAIVDRVRYLVDAA